MQAENANVFIGFCSDNFFAGQFFEATFPVLEEAMLWAAPKIKQGQGWKFVSQFFTLSNWILSFAVLIITALAFRYFARAAGESDKKYRTLSQCLLFIYSCFFNMGNSILPKDTKLRIICLSLGPFALNISAYLQGKMFGALTQPVYTERDGSFEELQASLPLVAQEHLMHLLLSSQRQTKFNFVKSQRPSMEYDLQDMVRYQDRATIVTQQVLQNHRHFKAYIQSQEIARFQIVFYVTKHSGFYNVIDNAIKKFTEHGLIRKIERDFKYVQMLHCMKYGTCWEGHTKVFKLTSSDLRGGFFVLNFGFAVGALVFFIEIPYYYFKSKEHNFYQRFKQKLRSVK